MSNLRNNGEYAHLRFFFLPKSRKKCRFFQNDPPRGGGFNYLSTCIGTLNVFFSHHCYRDVKIFNFSLLMFFKVLDNWAYHSNFRFRIYGYTHLGFSKKCITHLYTCRLLEYEPGNFATNLHPLLYLY